MAMAATLCCALPTRVPAEVASASCSGRIPTTSQQAGVGVGVKTRTIVPFQSRVGRGLSSTSGTRQGRQIRCASGSDGGEGKSSCCGGSGGGEGGQSSGKCSSHGISKDDSTADMSGIGKEFEALVAQKTLQGFEAQYETGQLEGTISRDVISDVVNIYPEAVNNKDNEEKFLDVEELIAEARALSSKDGDFIFDADFEDMLV